MDIETTFLQPAGSILVITGRQNAGKTAYCLTLVEGWRQAGLKTAGILSIGRFENGEKTGFHAHDLSGGESRLLVSRSPGELEGFQLDQWVFDPLVMEWGNQVLAEIESTDLLVIDELGPLEFQFRKGWTAAFDLLRQNKFRLAVVVIRLECLAGFSKMGFAYAVSEIPIQSPP
ncbi:MAG: nucleoside-triphosphatase [Anaerolineaceae bacterium]